MNNTLSPDNLEDLTILVVEDNMSNFILIARILESVNANCEWKTSGYEVLEFAKTFQKIDLILMDIHLPFQDGFVALKNIKKNESLKNTKIIAVTADSTPEHMKKAQSAGFDGFIGKPIDPEGFLSQISTVLSGEKIWVL